MKIDARSRGFLASRHIISSRRKRSLALPISCSTVAFFVRHYLGSASAPKRVSSQSAQQRLEIG